MHARRFPSSRLTRFRKSSNTSHPSSADVSPGKRSLESPLVPESVVSCCPKPDQQACYNLQVRLFLPCKFMILSLYLSLTHEAIYSPYQSSNTARYPSNPHLIHSYPFFPLQPVFQKHLTQTPTAVSVESVLTVHPVVQLLAESLPCDPVFPGHCSSSSTRPGPYDGNYMSIATPSPPSRQDAVTVGCVNSGLNCPISIGQSPAYRSLDMTFPIWENKSLA